MTYDLANRDATILALVQEEGMSLNKATKHYVALKKEAGLAVGVTSYKAEAMAYLTDLDLVSPIHPKPLVAELVTEYGVTADTAMGYIKAYADEHDMEIKTRLASTDILDWIVDNAPADDAEWDGFIASFREWMEAQGKSQSNINEYVKGIKLHLMLIAR